MTKRRPPPTSNLYKMVVRTSGHLKTIKPTAQTFLRSGGPYKCTKSGRKLDKCYRISTRSRTLVKRPKKNRSVIERTDGKPIQRT